MRVPLVTDRMKLTHSVFSSGLEGMVFNSDIRL